MHFPVDDHPDKSAAFIVVQKLLMLMKSELNLQNADSVPDCRGDDQNCESPTPRAQSASMSRSTPTSTPQDTCSPDPSHGKMGVPFPLMQ